MKQPCKFILKHLVGLEESCTTFWPLSSSHIISLVSYQEKVDTKLLQLALKRAMMLVDVVANQIPQGQ